MVDIDAIIDTRIGFIRTKYGEDVANEVLNSPSYYRRVSDELHLLHPVIDKTEFSLGYTGRNLEVLLNSRISCAIHYLGQFVNRISIELDGNNPFLADIHIVINFGQYEIDDDTVRSIMAGIQYTIDAPETVTFEAVKFDVKQITPQWLEDYGFYLYLVYDFNHWAMNALPDREGKGLDEIGLKRYENLLISTAKLMHSEKDYNELQQLMNDAGFSNMLNTFLEMPWNILFELELLPVGLFCEYNQEKMEEAMTAITGSTAPIDIAVEIASEYLRICFPESISNRDRLSLLKEQLVECNNTISSLLSGELDKIDYDTLRIELARSRFLTDTLSAIVPSLPAADYECFYDSLMSHFDVSYEASVESEKFWNEKGVKCNRFTKEIPRFNDVAYVLYCHEDCVDLDGKEWKKNTLLPSHLKFDTVLQPLSAVYVTDYLEKL